MGQNVSDTMSNMFTDRIKVSVNLTKKDFENFSRMANMIAGGRKQDCLVNIIRAACEEFFNQKNKPDPRIIIQPLGVEL
jgi:hypothetical protein